MGFGLEHDDDYAQRRLQRLEQRYHRAQFVLESEQAAYCSLRKTPGISQNELTQSVNRVRRAREDLEDILSTIEFLEAQHYSALAVRRIDSPSPRPERH
jgi:hypothetical protein